MTKQPKEWEDRKIKEFNKLLHGNRLYIIDGYSQIPEKVDVQNLVENFIISQESKYKKVLREIDSIVCKYNHIHNAGISHKEILSILKNNKIEL